METDEGGGDLSGGLRVKDLGSRGGTLQVALTLSVTPPVKCMILPDFGVQSLRLGVRALGDVHDLASVY